MTESKTYPVIQRSKREGMIFFPNNIKEIEKEMEGNLEIFYQYDLIKIPDTNQQIDDYELFKKENYSVLRRYKYGSVEKQLEIMQEQGFDAWQAYCIDIKDSLPKALEAEKQEPSDDS